MSHSTNLSRHPRRIDLDAPLHHKAGPTTHAMRPVEGAGEAQTPQACPAPSLPHQQRSRGLPAAVAAHAGEAAGNRRRAALP